jgi:hypothetical protein
MHVVIPAMAYNLHVVYNALANVDKLADVTTRSCVITNMKSVLVCEKLINFFMHNKTRL